MTEYQKNEKKEEPIIGILGQPLIYVDMSINAKRGSSSKG